ncbi:MAG: hypothetical protein Q4A97_05870, partial [Comamonadaceae bacterium]|nr:hypothetical protein [Comamonadaceae bacterium]
MAMSIQGLQACHPAQQARLKSRNFTGLTFSEPVAASMRPAQARLVPRETRRALDKLCTSLWVGGGWNAHNCAGTARACSYPQLRLELHGSRAQAFLQGK